MSSIRFLCQRCFQPLKLTPSLEASDLEPEASKLPSAQGQLGKTPEGGATSRVETEVEELQDGASGRTLPGHGEMSSNFTLLGRLGSWRTLHSIQTATSGIFSILSGDGLGHSLCEVCTDNLLEQLDAQLTISESDSRTYEYCLETRERTGEDETETLQEELKAAELEEARLAQELEEVERNRESAAVALEEARAETAALDQQERQYYRDYSKLKWQELELCDELRSLENRLRYAQTQIAWLEKTNAFRSAFEIREEGSLAVINTFRLGCLPAGPVSWDEIDAAWGQTALLLQALAKAVGLAFRRYRLVPCGSRSYLESLAEDSTKLPLFRGGAQSMLSYSKFDRAMVAFLDCMQQFKEEAGRSEPALCMPYRIWPEEGLIEDAGAGQLYSIRTCLNTEERWTKALKLMLTNFKWSLAWVSLRYSQK